LVISPADPIAVIVEIQRRESYQVERWLEKERGVNRKVFDPKALPIDWQTPPHRRASGKLVAIRAPAWRDGDAHDVEITDYH
jgi:hypothetical protein